MALAGGKPAETPQQWSDTGELLVPVLDMDGKLWAAQSIEVVPIERVSHVAASCKAGIL